MHSVLIEYQELTRERFHILGIVGDDERRYRLPEILEDAVNGLPDAVRQLINGLLAHFKELDRQAAELERQIRLWHREHASSRKLERIPGIGPITASAYVASIGNANSFHNGRQVSAWVGLVPRRPQRERMASYT